MKAAYPVVFREDKDDKVPFYVYVPDLDVSTQGTSMTDAIEMARDAIQLKIVSLEDDKRDVPKPNTASVKTKQGDIVSYVDIDSTKYRAALKNLSVKKNCTIPQWLAEKAEKAGINFSQVLQEALKSTSHELPETDGTGGSDIQ